MAKYLAAASVLGTTPCTAFTSNGNLRTQSSPVSHPGSVDVPVDQIADASPSSMRIQASIGLLGLGATGMAMVARMSKKPPRSSRVPCRVAGVSLPIGAKWDPANLGNTDAKMERYTAVEIKHGRISMIATLGYIFPEIFRFPGCEEFKNGLGSFTTLPVEGWVQLFLFIGAHEILVKPRQGGMGQYDFGLGTELLEGIDEAELERRQTVERNNGRLAMVAIIGMMWQDGMFGKTPIQELGASGWWSGKIGFITQNIPACVQGSVNFCALPRSSGRVSRTARQAWLNDNTNQVIISPATAKKLMASKRWAVANPTGERLPTPAELPRSPAIPFLRYPEQLRDWVGGEKGFDPLGFSFYYPTYWLREAELKHGRVCMLATVGWIATDLGLRFPGEKFQGFSTLEAHDKMVAAGIMAPLLGASFAVEFYAFWLTMKGFMANDNIKGFKRDAGDFFLGKQFLPKDPEAEKIMRLKELENGRLAMLAFAGIVTLGQATKTPWPFF